MENENDEKNFLTNLHLLYKNYKPLSNKKKKKLKKDNWEDSPNIRIDCKWAAEAADRPLAADRQCTDCRNWASWGSRGWQSCLWGRATLCHWDLAATGRLAVVVASALTLSMADSATFESLSLDHPFLSFWRTQNRSLCSET
ncbi:hypothetical protein BpHYR1_019785 [Brachionus plicatilis]|uniref:Uncharacterized protein n=1 Tax=Brachionus plicatilis TaxID=10195 RepID=A0A3M7QLH0_BRAPC|nr:hypothetical protein BpHYR1_019785 [Brachionus plicatilis]